MRRLILAVVVTAGTVLAMAGSTPPRIAEIQALSRLGPAELTLVQQGRASYYADSFHGRQTASGARMNQNALTAASKDLPLGTRAKVTNLATGESVEVAVNDRGPFVPGRVIDLSKRAADAIDMREDGVAPVRIEVKPEDQPTPALRDKVAKMAAAKERAKHRSARHVHKKTPAKSPAPPQIARSE